MTDHGTAFHVELTRRDHYDVLIENGLADRLGEVVRPIAERARSSAVFVVSDDIVAGFHGRRVLESLRLAGLPARLIEVPSGERAKSPQGLMSLWQALYEQGAQRRDLLVAFGGGVICDLTALAAATFMRGLPYVNVPTSLLAQVDAGIGGKAGIDFADVKNLIGAFHQPHGVFIDPGLLATLPRMQFVNGCAEVCKVALIADADLFALIEAEGAGLLSADHPKLVSVISRSVQLKIELLRADPYERRSMARVLNLGHCFGHPIEAASDYTLAHGEAVAMGLAVATSLGTRRGLCSPGMFTSVLSAIDALELPSKVPEKLRDSGWTLIESLRRVRNGDLQPIIPVRPGHCVVGADLSRTEWDDAIDTLEGRHAGR